MKLVPGTIYTLWDRDMPAMVFNHNLYGSHPFFVGVVDGTAYGVLLLSSNGMDIYLEDSSVVYKVIGGIIDLYVFSGPTPADVAAQYTELIGRPALQPTGHLVSTIADTDTALFTKLKMLPLDTSMQIFQLIHSGQILTTWTHGKTLPPIL